jgi:mRNA-degrading endonuclease toxin of MazEF toxin-antitoxin module
MKLAAGQIILMNLRDALPNEPGKRARPCVVVEDPRVFAEYANVIVVPLTHDRAASFSMLMTTIDPTPENGCSERCYAISAHVASSSRTRIVRATESHVSAEQLATIRAQIALCIAA